MGRLMNDQSIISDQSAFMDRPDSVSALILTSIVCLFVLSSALVLCACCKKRKPRNKMPSQGRRFVLYDAEQTSVSTELPSQSLSVNEEDDTSTDPLKRSKSALATKALMLKDPLTWADTSVNSTGSQQYLKQCPFIMAKLAPIDTRKLLSIPRTGQLPRKIQHHEYIEVDREMSVKTGADSETDATPSESLPSTRSISRSAMVGPSSKTMKPASTESQSPVLTELSSIRTSHGVGASLSDSHSATKPTTTVILFSKNGSSMNQ